MNEIIKKNKSVCFTPIPINACLKAVDDWLEEDLPWSPVNETQKEYLEKFFEKDSAEYDFVKRIASDKTEIINNFLAENGFPEMQIPKLMPPEFGIASVMDQIVEWMHQGKSIKMRGQDDNIYEAVEFAGLNLGDLSNFNEISFNNNPAWVYHIFTPLIHPHFVAMIRTKSDDRVFLTFLNSIPDDEVKFEFEMMELAQKITDESKKIHPSKFMNSLGEDYRLIIPKIDFEGDVNIDWIIEMRTKYFWFIKYAKMKVKLKLNHIGARAQGVAVMIMTLGGSPIPTILKFDRPFMIWFTHQGKVTFVMYVDYEQWKDPGDDIFG